MNDRKREVEEKAKQLEQVASLSALIAGFALVSMVEINIQGVVCVFSGERVAPAGLRGCLRPKLLGIKVGSWSSSHEEVCSSHPKSDFVQTESAIRWTKPLVPVYENDHFAKREILFSPGDFGLKSLLDQKNGAATVVLQHHASAGTLVFTVGHSNQDPRCKQNVYMTLFLLAIFGPDYLVPPYNSVL